MKLKYYLKNVIFCNLIKTMLMYYVGYIVTAKIAQIIFEKMVRNWPNIKRKNISY